MIRVRTQARMRNRSRRDGGGAPRETSQELLDLIDHLVGFADAVEVVGSRELDQTSLGQMLGQVAPMPYPHDLTVPAVEDESWCPHQRQE
jgi:hypothetical protein